LHVSTRLFATSATREDDATKRPAFDFLKTEQMGCFAYMEAALSKKQRPRKLSGPLPQTESIKNL
jgi:hypothetical protein